MKTFVLKLPSGDTLLKTNDPCLALRVSSSVECDVILRTTGTYINDEVLRELCEEKWIE